MLKEITCGDAGVMALEAPDALPVPALLVAVTVNVYATPLVRPATVIGEPLPVPVAPPGLAVTVYPVMVPPPLLAGAVNVTEAWVSPAVALPIVGGPGRAAATLKVRLTVGAGEWLPSPAWSASMVQLPLVRKVNVPPDVVVHTPVVEELKLTGSVELLVADSVGAVPKFCVPGLAKVIVWVSFGVTAFDAAEAVLVPMALVAVTVNV